MTEVRSCRICFDNENQENLISPCGCKGSSEFIHKDCLNTWLQNNKGEKNYSHKYNS